MRIISEFENYAVDENGNVFNVKRRRQLITAKDRNGYISVALSKEGKVVRKKVHRLVAEAYIPNPQNLPQINHKDENKENNSVNNLEWCNARYNNFYGNSKPTVRAQEARKKAVCQYSVDGKLINVFESATEAQRKTGIHQSNISKCCLQRKNFHTAGGYVWKFK